MAPIDSADYVDHIYTKKFEEERYNLIKDIAKMISYPVLGALSDNAKNKLEKIVGKDWFNARDATMANILVNLPAYPIMAGILTYNNKYGALALMGGVAAMFIEGLLRLSMRGNAGSLLGKMVSLPFEGKEKAEEYYK